MPSTWWSYVVGTVDITQCNESADPRCLSFAHTFVMADSEDAAYREGQRMMGFQQEPGLVRNDYVFPARL